MKKNKILNFLGWFIGILLCMGMVGYITVTNNPQLVVGIIQKGIYKEANPSSFEPLNEAYKGLKENGQYLISEIKYSEEYPNSYLDIIYTDNNTEVDRPTLFYFHGGGFFGGSKNMGDPLAESEATYLIDDIVAKGYNVVNVDYALVPDYHFPTPLVQMNQAIAYIKQHAKEYNLNVNNVVLMGSSAGGIMTSQYGSILTNEHYASLLGIVPSIEKDKVKALVIDDAPLDYKNFPLGTKMLVGNYVSGSIYLSDDEIKKYNNIYHITSEYPATFLLGSEYRKDMLTLHEALEKVDVENELVDPLVEYGIEKQHGFVANLRNDEISMEAFHRLIDFINNETKK
ncbi:alpha/beta hydrolase [Paenibacillus amylolyticus]|uniref:alpha/beta hydrolase n=1 Tax=Paenibacillus amylolyticus TaxID=1451 RepID=UPI0032422AFC